MKKLLLITIILLTGCSTYMKYFPPETAEQKINRLNYKIQRQLDHDRIVSDCYMTNHCKGRYKIYNRKWIRKHYKHHKRKH